MRQETVQAPREPETTFSTSSIHQARLRMRQRNPKSLSNRELSARSLERYGRFKAETISHWEEVVRTRRLSMRSGLCLLRVARTVADLQANDHVSLENLASAICFRSFDVAEPWN